MANQIVNFRLRNTGTQALTIDYVFADTDLFEYIDPAGPTELALPVDGEILGSFRLKKNLVDQEIVNLSFQSKEGPQIVVSLRSSVTPASPPPALPWSFNTNETGLYMFYCVTEEDTRALLGSLLVEDAGVDYDVTDIMTSEEMLALPGVGRTFFVVRLDSNTSGQYETAVDLNYGDAVGEGSFNTQGITPPEGEHGLLVPFNSCYALLIEDVTTSACAISATVVVAT